MSAFFVKLYAFSADYIRSNSINNSIDVRFVIMAAGESSRFQGCKLLADYRGRTIIDHSIWQLQQAGVKKVTIVTGAYHQRLTDHLNSSPLHASSTQIDLIYNPDWAKGLGASIACCSNHLPVGAHLCIVLADQVRLDAEHLKVLMLEAAQHPDKIVCTNFTKTVGPPVVFPPRSRHALNRLSGEQGAKHIIQASDCNVSLVSFPQAQFDIDTQEDLINANNKD